MATVYTICMWINAAEATILRQGPDGTIARQHMDSGVPSRHHATNGSDQEAWAFNEGNRNQHLHEFFSRAAGALAAADDLMVVGDGVVPEQFVDYLSKREKGRKPARRVVVERSQPLSENQLAARLRTFAGRPAKREE